MLRKWVLWQQGHLPVISKRRDPLQYDTNRMMGGHSLSLVNISCWIFPVSTNGLIIRNVIASLSLLPAALFMLTDYLDEFLK